MWIICLHYLKLMYPHTHTTHIHTPPPHTHTHTHTHRHTGYWEALLAMMLLCYCTVHAYRITGFVLAYMTLRLVELVVAS